MVKLCTFETPEQMVDSIIALLQQTLPTAGSLMLSGGTTPYAAYDRIAATPGPVHRQRKLFLSDERMVPLHSPMNNAGNLLPMLRALQCEDRFIRIATELPAQEAAEQYARALDGLNPIDLGLLGMGNDGHTAGIFDMAQEAGGPPAFSTQRPDGMEGVTVAPSLLQRIKRIILLVSGESKRSIVNTLLKHPERIPAGIALSGHPGVELWTDVLPD